ncbi:hypothetical protein F4781DRAFT_378848 [Annulohypoxylon bovei var. microspora]|nr:hypothetical protein F4781DRAFT_378848 [Annulohypoxylon bovei var. microspora]
MKSFAVRSTASLLLPPMFALSLGPRLWDGCMYRGCRTADLSEKLNQGVSGGAEPSLNSSMVSGPIMSMAAVIV